MLPPFLWLSYITLPHKNREIKIFRKSPGILDTYELPRFSRVPKIETRLIDNPGMPPQGRGEPAITSMGGVIANAFYDAVAVRLFELPMTPDRVKEALKK